MSEGNLIKHGVRLKRDDIEVIQQAYPELGYSKIIRYLVRRLAEKIRAGQTEAIRELQEEILDE